MQIIKDKEIVENTWEFISDDAAIKAGNITVSVARLLKEGEALAQRDGKLGVRIEPADSVETITPYLSKLSLIELNFPDLTDGRLFSHAWLLRNRLGYQGEIRATGDYVTEQVFYLSRVGVNAFSPEKPEDLPVILDCLQDFSVNYQPSVN